MNGLVANTLWIYGLAAVVSLLIAAIIKLIVVLLGRSERAAPAPAPAVGQAAALPGADAQLVAAIGAALYACIGEHRIVHIEDAAHGAGWAAEGRLAHHSGHRPSYRSTPR
jgi:hypothetical protein